MVNVAEAKFLMLGVIAALSVFLIYDTLQSPPVITINDKPIVQPAVNINLSKEPETGKISGILDGPTVVNISSFNNSK